MRPANILRIARKKAGLSQRELAARAGVPQSTIARIETGEIDPRNSTLDRVLSECGYSLELEQRLGIGIDRTQIHNLLAVRPRERVEQMAQAARAVVPLRGAARRGAARR
jgi:predicted transcriptional regulator